MENNNNENSNKSNNGNMTDIIKAVITFACVCVAGVAIVASTLIFTKGLVTYKTNGQGGLSATGSASVDFEADLIVWRGTYSTYAKTTGEAYNSDVVFSAIDISRRYVSNYNDEGNYVGDTFDGYELYQTVTVSSEDVDSVEEVSRDITELIEQGVEFTSNNPEYYYKDLDSLKLELVQAATENAKQRIDLMAEGSGCKPGKLVSSNLGVFQITAKNSADDEYSSGGTYNTSSREKTATITVKLNYTVD